MFIAISDDARVYAFNGHVDLGTGIRTSLAQIVAEELDLQLEQVCMVLGDTERVPNQGATIASATLQISAIPLRNAAAEARRFLLERAAERWSVEAGSLTVEAGVIVAADGRTTSYADLVRGDHVELRLSGTAPLKSAEDYRLVGKGSARVDIPAKATGELTYVHDMRVPDMLHGRVIRPPYAGLDCGDFVGNSLLDVDRAALREDRDDDRHAGLGCRDLGRGLEERPTAVDDPDQDVGEYLRDAALIVPILVGL